MLITRCNGTLCFIQLTKVAVPLHHDKSIHLRWPARLNNNIHSFYSSSSLSFLEQAVERQKQFSVDKCLLEFMIQIHNSVLGVLCFRFGTVLPCPILTQDTIAGTRIFVTFEAVCRSLSIYTLSRAYGALCIQIINIIQNWLLGKWPTSIIKQQETTKH